MTTQSEWSIERRQVGESAVAILKRNGFQFLSDTGETDFAAVKNLRSKLERRVEDGRQAQEALDALDKGVTL